MKWTTRTLTRTPSWNRAFEIEGVCATQDRVTEASVDEFYYEARRILDLTPLYLDADRAMPDWKTPQPSPASRFVAEPQRLLLETWWAGQRFTFYRGRLAKNLLAVLEESPEVTIKSLPREAAHSLELSLPRELQET